jgi:hypothetical protein
MRRVPHVRWLRPCLLLAWILAAVLRPAAADDDATLIAPGSHVGPVTASASEDDLTQRFGVGSVRAASIEIGEGFTEPGTIVFPDEPTRRMEILWRDEKSRRQPDRVQLTGDKSIWHFANGVTLGTTLKELERLNGKPFMLTGFGWDYGGTVVSWNGGALGDALAGSGSCFLRLTPDYDDPNDVRLEQQLLGDRDFLSSDPAMQAINPTVEQIIVGF